MGRFYNTDRNRCGRYSIHAQTIILLQIANGITLKLFKSAGMLTMRDDQ